MNFLVVLNFNDYQNVSVHGSSSVETKCLAIVQHVVMKLNNIINYASWLSNGECLALNWQMDAGECYEENIFLMKIDGILRGLIVFVHHTHQFR